MLIPSNITPTDLNPLSDCIVDRFICHDDIPSLAKCWDDARDRRKGLGVDNARLSAKVGGDIGLGLDVHVLCPVESWRRARTYAIGSKDLNGTLLKVRIGAEGVEVV